MNRYELEELKIELLKASTACLHGLAYGLPYVALALSVSFVIHSTLSEPFSLTCKTTPPDKVARPQKKRAPTTEPVFLPAKPDETPTPIIKMKPAEIG